MLGTLSYIIQVQSTGHPSIFLRARPWKLCQNYDLQCNKTWYDYSPEEVMKNDHVKLLWDLRIQTDHHLHHDRPHIVILEKESRVCQIVHVACHFDTRIAEKEREKIDHHQYLKVEIHCTRDMELQKCICCCNWGRAVTKT